MKEFYYDTITFISGWPTTIKVLVIGMLFCLVVFGVRNIVKTHVNPKKTIFKFSQFFVLALLIALTIFISVNSF